MAWSILRSLVSAERSLHQRSTRAQAAPRDKGPHSSQVRDVDGIISVESSAVDGLTGEKDALESSVAEVDGIISVESSAVEGLTGEKDALESSVAEVDGISSVECH